MNRFFAEKIEDNIAHLSKEDSMHLARVLRMEVGETVELVFDNKLYLGNVADNNNKKALIEITEELKVESEPNLKVTLFQGLPKAGKMELIIQKCVELGIHSIVPIETVRCVSKAKDSKDERFNRVAYEACKQCKRVYVPKIEKTMKIKDIDVNAFDAVLVAYEKEDKVSIKKALNELPNLTSVAIVIGPEGGLEEDEVQELLNRGAKSISLGKRILRTETAGMAVTSMVLYHYDEMELN